MNILKKRNAQTGRKQKNIKKAIIMELINWKEYEEGYAMVFCIEQVQRNLNKYAANHRFLINQPDALNCSKEHIQAAVQKGVWERHSWAIKASEKLRYHSRITLLNALLEYISELSELDIPIRAYKSEKEMKIQEARKRWLKSRDNAESLLLAYKIEKGDFYKKTT